MAAATQDNSTIDTELKSVSTLCRLYICGLNRNANGGFSRIYKHIKELKLPYKEEMGTQMCNKSKNLPNLYRLMNYLNAMSWPCVKDGMDGMLYSSEYLVSPRFIVTEDGMMDITTIMSIPYSHFNMDTLQIEDYFTAALPALLDSLSAPIFLLLEGRINVEDAIDIIETELQGKN